MDPVHHGNCGYTCYPAEPGAPAEASVGSPGLPTPEFTSSAPIDSSPATVLSQAGGLRAPVPAGLASATIQASMESTGEALLSESLACISEIIVHPPKSRPGGQIHWIDSRGDAHTTYTSRDAASLLRILTTAPDQLFSKTRLSISLPEPFDLSKAAHAVRGVLKKVPGHDLLTVRHSGDNKPGYILRTRALQPLLKRNYFQLSSFTISGPARQGGAQEVSIWEEEYQMLIKLFNDRGPGVKGSKLQECFPGTKKSAGELVDVLRRKLQPLALTIEYTNPPLTGC